MRHLASWVLAILVSIPPCWAGEAAAEKPHSYGKPVARRLHLHRGGPAPRAGRHRHLGGAQGFADRLPGRTASVGETRWIYC